MRDKLNYHFKLTSRDLRESLAYRIVPLVSGVAFLTFMTRGLGLIEFSLLQLLLVSASVASALGEGVALVAQRRVRRNRFIWYTFLFLSTLLVPINLLIALCAGLYVVGSNFEIISLLLVYVALSTGLWGLLGSVKAVKPEQVLRAGIAFEIVKTISAFLLVVVLGYGISGALLSLILAQVVQAAAFSYHTLPRRTFLDLDLAKRVPLRWGLFFLPLISYFMMVDVFVVAHATGWLEFVGYYRALFVLAMAISLVCRSGWNGGIKVALPAAVFFVVLMKHVAALLGPEYSVLGPTGPLVATVGILLAANIAVDEGLMEDGTALKIAILQNPIYLFAIYIIFRDWEGSLLSGLLAWFGTLMSFLVAALIVKWSILSRKNAWPISAWRLRGIVAASFVEGLVLFLLGFFVFRPVEGLLEQSLNVALLAIVGGLVYAVALWTAGRLLGRTPNK